jgi:hypothetical protein
MNFNPVDNPGSFVRPVEYFIAQIDSFEFKGEENPNAKEHGDVHFMFGDVGMIYVWFCFDCLKPLATMDCY